jgi:hypothetical protein
LYPRPTHHPQTKTPALLWRRLATLKGKTGRITKEQQNLVTVTIHRSLATLIHQEVKLSQKIVPNSNLLAGRNLCLQMMAVYVSRIQSLLIEPANFQMKGFLLILLLGKMITYDVLHLTTSFWVDSSAKIP